MYLFKMGLLTTKIIGLPMKAEVVVYSLIAVKMQFASGNEVTKRFNGQSMRYLLRLIRIVGLLAALEG